MSRHDLKRKIYGTLADAPSGNDVSVFWLLVGCAGIVALLALALWVAQGLGW